MTKYEISAYIVTKLIKYVATLMGCRYFNSGTLFRIMGHIILERIKLAPLTSAIIENPSKISPYNVKNNDELTGPTTETIK